MGGGLSPLGHIGGPQEAAKLERLQKAWHVIVGPGLGRATHPISIGNGLLLVGCHDTSALKSLRASAGSAWPELRGRIDAMLGTHLQRIEITPSDPPPRQGRAAAPAAAEGRDPLEAVLDYYRAHRKGGGRAD